MVIDRCFEGWDGIATLADAGRLHDDHRRPIPLFGKLQIYDAWDYPYICIEPVTNANDGFNRAALGVPGHAVAGARARAASLAGERHNQRRVASQPNARVHECEQRGVT